MHTSRSSWLNWSLTISICLGGNSKSGLPSNLEFFVRRRRMGFKMACALEPDHNVVKVKQNNKKRAYLLEGRRQTGPLPGSH